MMDRRGRARSFRRVASPGVEVETRWVRCGLVFFYTQRQRSSIDYPIDPLCSRLVYYRFTYDHTLYNIYTKKNLNVLNAVTRAPLPPAKPPA